MASCRYYSRLAFFVRTKTRREGGYLYTVWLLLIVFPKMPKWYRYDEHGRPVREMYGDVHTGTAK
jgi:hypothetical protein